MTRSKTLLAVAALAGMLAAGAAQAGGPDIRWSVTIGSPAVVPVYGAPIYAPPMVVQPMAAPVYVTPYASPYVVYGPAPRWERHERHRAPRWDVDGDGIPNRYDRIYNPRWDRDGDGIPNRYDPYPDHPRRGGWGR